MKFISEEIPYSSHVSPDVVSTKRFGWVMGFKVQGITFETRSDSELHDAAKMLNSVLMGMHDASTTIYHQVIRHKTKEYPEGDGSTPYAKKFIADYKSDFVSNGMLRNDLFIFLHYSPYSRMTKPELKKLDDIEQLHQEAIKSLREKADIIKGALNSSSADSSTGFGFDVEVLEVEKRGGQFFSPLMEVLSYLINGYWSPVLAFPNERFSETLPDSTITFSNSGGVLHIENMYGSKYAGVLEIISYADPTYSTMMDSLISLPYEMNITHSFSCIQKATALGYLSRQEAHLSDSGDKSESQILQFRQAMDDLSSDRIKMGLHHCIVIVYSADVNELNQSMGKVIGLMATCGIVMKKLGVATQPAYWSVLPGNESKRPRPSAISTANMSEMASLHNFLVGKIKGNPWGPAMMLLKTTSGSPHYLSFHKTGEKVNSEGELPPGSTILFGSTGEGKTTLLAGMLTHADKFNPKVVICDKDRGLQAWVLAMGGKYYEIRPGIKTGWNPFQRENNAMNRAHCMDLIRIMATSNGEDFNHIDKKEAETALKSVFEDLPIESRSINTLMQLIPRHDDDKRACLGERLDRWAGDGEYSWVFGSDHEALDFGSTDYVGFDFTYILDLPVVKPAVLAYILNRSLELITKVRPMILAIDEYWKFDKDDWFRGFVNDFILTKRKENALLILSTQDPVAAANSDISSTLLGQIPTKIFMRDRMGTRETYVERFNMPEPAFEIFKTFGQGERKFMLQQGSGTCVCIYDLSHVRQYIPIMSGDKVRGEIAKECIRELGHQVDKWIPEYLERCKNAS